jgi:hypothetical protein
MFLSAGRSCVMGLIRGTVHFKPEAQQLKNNVRMIRNVHGMLSSWEKDIFHFTSNQIQLE